MSALEFNKDDIMKSLGVDKETILSFLKNNRPKEDDFEEIIATIKELIGIGKSEKIEDFIIECYKNMLVEYKNKDQNENTYFDGDVSKVVEAFFSLVDKAAKIQHEVLYTSDCSGVSEFVDANKKSISGDGVQIFISGEGIIVDDIDVISCPEQMIVILDVPGFNLSAVLSSDYELVVKGIKRNYDKEQFELYGYKVSNKKYLYHGRKNTNFEARICFPEICFDMNNVSSVFNDGVLQVVLAKSNKEVCIPISKG